MVLLSIDPGGTTGLSLFAEGRLIEARSVQLDLLETFLLLTQLLPSIHVTEVVAEEFIIRPVAANEWGRAFTLRQLGVIEVAVALNELKLTLQTAAYAFQFIDTEKIQGVGDTHARSSVCHGLRYLYTKKVLSARECYSVARTGLRTPTGQVRGRGGPLSTTIATVKGSTGTITAP